MRWAVALLFLPGLSMSDSTDFRKSDIFDFHGPTCDTHDMHGLLADTRALTENCLNTLYDLRDNTWDGKHRTLDEKLRLPDEARLKAQRRHFIRLLNAHRYLGTTLTEEALPGLVERGFQESSRDQEILEYVIDVLETDVLPILFPDPEGGVRKRDERPTKAFIACDAKAYDWLHHPRVSNQNGENRGRSGTMQISCWTSEDLISSIFSFTFEIIADHPVYGVRQSTPASRMT